LDYYEIRLDNYAKIDAFHPSQNKIKEDVILNISHYNYCPLASFIPNKKYFFLIYYLI